MTKWADFLISGVRFNAEETHIDEVEVHRDLGETIEDATATVHRLTVVKNIENKITYITISKSKTDPKSWVKGQEVGVFPYDGNKYLRTYKDGTPTDNLDNLPRC